MSANRPSDRGPKAPRFSDQASAVFANSANADAFKPLLLALGEGGYHRDPLMGDGEHEKLRTTHLADALSKAFAAPGNDRVWLKAEAIDTCGITPLRNPIIAGRAMLDRGLRTLKIAKADGLVTVKTNILHDHPRFPKAVALATKACLLISVPKTDVDAAKKAIAGSKEFKNDLGVKIYVRQVRDPNPARLSSWLLGNPRYPDKLLEEDGQHVLQRSDRPYSSTEVTRLAEALVQRQFGEHLAAVGGCQKIARDVRSKMKASHRGRSERGQIITDDMWEVCIAVRSVLGPDSFLPIRTDTPLRFRVSRKKAPTHAQLRKHFAARRLAKQKRRQRKTADE